MVLIISFDRFFVQPGGKDREHNSDSLRLAKRLDGSRGNALDFEVGFFGKPDRLEAGIFGHGLA